MTTKRKKSLCAAKSKQNNHAPCRRFGMKNGRCKLHGGMSTGPKTKEGKMRSARANYKHGLYTKEAMKEKKKMRKLLLWKGELKELIEQNIIL